MQLLGYWHQFMPVYEAMQEEEIKILSPLLPHHRLLTASTCLRGIVPEAGAYCVPLSASWQWKHHSISSKKKKKMFKVWKKELEISQWTNGDNGSYDLLMASLCQAWVISLHVCNSFKVTINKWYIYVKFKRCEVYSEHCSSSSCSTGCFPSPRNDWG